MKSQPINTLHLFPLLDDLLIKLLLDLDTEQWNSPTIAKSWTVKDIAAHLLDGNLRTISMYRDDHFSEAPQNIHTYGDLVNYLNNLNASWVTAAKRLSPKLLTDLLAETGKPHNEQLAKLDPQATALFSVAWAGEATSLNWFNIAREYTEKFIHQMQIRDAVNLKEALFTKELFHPFITTFMYGLPHTYRNVSAPDKTVIEIIVETGAGGNFFLIRFDNNWVLDTQSLHEPVTTVSILPDTAWKLFSKGITKEQALAGIKITGDIKLGGTVLDMVSVMA